jgi:hypothetical protein
VVEQAVLAGECEGMYAAAVWRLCLVLHFPSCQVLMLIALPAYVRLTHDSSAVLSVPDPDPPCALLCACCGLLSQV